MNFSTLAPGISRRSTSALFLNDSHILTVNTIMNINHFCEKRDWQNNSARGEPKHANSATAEWLSPGFQN
jgi:hypothetical protein